MKFNGYPVAIIIVCLGIGVLLLSLFNIEVAIEPYSPVPSPIPDTPATPQPPSPPPALTPTPGGLRVSNQTDSPVRVALLYQQEGENVYSQPAHWDFAPGEGRTQGLILSLPDRDLRLRPGDILVAFAQDGSRQYWGPFVVGETAQPVLDSETQEWRLMLTR
ncbi:hypothetical protein QQ054_31255 [Oscillatoria amoena NRMC-F 0135]|nr:hypothetical protein [Desertifilum sp.]MDI9635757.1 hypothetical protein [Geitlerinema splendidum]MDL5050483.1 hypothetical protein [Oscillatoria amoena NRMC-F 0135]